MASSQPTSACDGNVSVKGTIKNSSPGELQHPVDNDDPCHYDWAGELVGNYPGIITQDEQRSFTHQEKHEHTDGSVAAVIYTGINSKAKDCAWLLAWMVPGPEDKRRVYVKCGPINEFKPDPIFWGLIRQKLVCSDGICDDTNEATRTKASAKIDERKYPAELQAIFEVY